MKILKLFLVLACFSMFACDYFTDSSKKKESQQKIVDPPKKKPKADPKVSFQTPSPDEPLQTMQLPEATDESPVAPTAKTDQANVYVQKGCCPCQSGGELIALNLTAVVGYESRLKGTCSQNPICPQQYNCQDWKQKCKSMVCSANVLRQIGELSLL